MALTDMLCRMAQPYPKLSKLSDTGGLQLWIQPNGSRLWRFAYRYAGKQKTLALGTYPTVSLSDARQARDDAKRVLASGGDPAIEKKLRKAEVLGATFREIAAEYMERKKREGCSDSTITRDKRLLDAAYPLLGSVPIRTINAPMILKALQKVEERGRFESARRMRATIGAVFRYAIVTARAEVDPTEGRVPPSGVGASAR